MAVGLLLGSATTLWAQVAVPTIDELAQRASEIEILENSAEEYAAASEGYRELEELATRIETDELDVAAEIDLELLRAFLDLRLFEIEELRIHELVPVRYLRLGNTDSLLLRPCAAGVAAVEEAIEELGRLPRVLANGQRNLKRPARVWTENAIEVAKYAELLLTDELPRACLLDEASKQELLRAAGEAAIAVSEFASWLEVDLLPRSDRAPVWRPEEIERYQFGQERLVDFGVDRMIEIAALEESRLLTEMSELAERIHPSGDLETVWELMKEEAPPWQEVLPMAERYVELTARWLEGSGAHVLGIPDRFDYGVVLTTPMARRILSFGGASYGPTVAGRISGYYVLTPLESWLTEEEAASRIRSYNPYWTHVISYHEWVGHNVQRAWAQQAPKRPARGLLPSAYLSQSWSFYLEKLFEDEGYFETLPWVEALKTRMARLQMRMWRVQRILTKLRMAKGEMTFDEAVDAYIEKIGMEPTNAFIEVQRDSQSPASPGREIIGERVILEMRDEYQRRMGSHYRMRDFHESLLQLGDLPLPMLRRLMFGG